MPDDPTPEPRAVCLSCAAELKVIVVGDVPHVEPCAGCIAEGVAVEVFKQGDSAPAKPVDFGRAGPGQR